uniref:Apple domain-containing protein n=1 Tax=Rhabditophanes sp. KR3021 TaxID=114890 RepID=A0AC35U504_9BILA
MYRSDKDEPSTTTTTTTTPEPTTTTTMRSTTTRRLTTAFVPRTSAPRQTSQPRTVVTNRNSQIISSNTETQFVRNNVRPQQLINSGHVQTVQRPQTTQAPRIIAPLTTRTAFVPQQQQSRFQPGFHQPRPVLQTRTGFSNPPPRTRPTAPPTRFPVTRATTQKPRNIQSFTPRQQNRPQPNTGNLRTGVCRASIFYLTSVPNQHDTNQQFTHFALVVSVDQCARTCHEFNCAVAIFDSNTKHCQFIPATSFSIREGQCPNWPNPLFRNNALGTNSIRISCVTCQRRRRNFQRVRGMSRGFRGSRPQPATLQTTRFLPQTINRSAITNIRLNGVVLKQSTSKAISTAELESRQISDNVNSQLQKS